MEQSFQDRLRQQAEKLIDELIQAQEEKEPGSSNQWEYRLLDANWDEIRVRDRNEEITGRHWVPGVYAANIQDAYTEFFILRGPDEDSGVMWFPEGSPLVIESVYAILAMGHATAYPDLRSAARGAVLGE